MTTQLRIYTIQQGKMDAFLKAWKTGIYPLRQQFGFAIPHAWVAPESSQFIWILTYDGDEAAFAARNTEYYASPGRVDMMPDPAQYIYRADEKFISPLEMPRLA
jgi:hypothetical protein